MDFSLTPDQELLRDTGRKLLERECPPALVRAHIDDPTVYEPLWRHLSEYTALGTGPATDLCLFLAETGYAAAPGPFLATALYGFSPAAHENHPYAPWSGAEPAGIAHFRLGDDTAVDGSSLGMIFSSNSSPAAR